MKTLYLDCGMGAAGDMLTAALVELLPSPDAFIEKLHALAIPGVYIKKESAVKCGITGTHIAVMVHGMEESEEIHGHSHDHGHDHGHDHDHDQVHTHHHHSGMHEIEHIISELHLTQKVRDDVLAVYGLIAEAESHVHGVPVTEIHFHEVGTMDAVADITAVCLLMDELSPDKVVVSPVHVGSGHVKCAHGLLPVPAPATAYILKDVPIYGGEIKGELCTPTGAALLKHFATRFGDMPVMKTQAIGYGMGKKDFQTANCVRAMLGETTDKTDVVLELSCNVDDMTAEAISFATERLFEGGAHEVYTVPIGMKKSRPGTLIRVICREQDKEKITGLLFKYTTTIGIRESVTHRYILDRKIETVQTPYGDARRKVSSGYGVSRSKYEYEDLARIAKEQKISLDEVKSALETCDTSFYMDTLHEKKQHLESFLRELGSVVVAFSSGVDSTFLLKVAHHVLGEKVIAVTARSCSFPVRELNEARAFCEAEGIEHIIVESEELSIEGFRQNPENRCYLCKRELFTKIRAIAEERGIPYIAEGSNMDDNGDYRPGLIAVAELEVKSPLREAELTKAEIRQLSKEMGLLTWDKQSFACLSSRFVYGETITEEKLSMVDRAEQKLLDLGFHQVRVRVHGNIARIEIDRSEFDRIIQPEVAEPLNQYLHELGFLYVTLDLGGYQMGSMNKTLDFNTGMDRIT